jgi:hypothetical protein
MTLVRNGLIEMMGADNATKFVKTLCKMNVYSMRCRYGDVLRVVKLDDSITEVPNAKATLAMLGCVSYQLREGDTDTKFAKQWKEMLFVQGQLALEILRTQPSDNNMPYGIFSKAEIANFSHCIKEKEALTSQTSL